MQVIDKLNEGFRKHKAAREAAFLKMARDLASGKDVSIASIERMLADSGKTQADLTSILGNLEVRGRLEKRLVKPGEYDRERAKIQGEIAAADEEFRLADEKHTATIVPLSRRLSELERAESESEQARSQLILTCIDPELVNRHRIATQELTAKRDELFATRQSVGRNNTLAKEAAEDAKAANSTHRFEDLAEKAKDAERARDAAQDRIPEIEARIGELETEIMILENEMLTP